MTQPNHAASRRSLLPFIQSALILGALVIPTAAAASPIAMADPGQIALAMADSRMMAEPDPDPAGSTSFPQPSGSIADATPDAKRWALFGQSTFTVMSETMARMPYSGPHSLIANDTRETFDATLYLGVRPWSGGEIWVNGEVDQGFGIGNTMGLAGYASGEAYKLGAAQPYTRLQRVFLRQTFALGGETSAVEAGANQMPGRQSANRLVITAGKFGVVDVFDTNKYAHDPRGDFLNWALIDSGAFDYAGDPWGFSYGASAELYVGAWTLRAGAFNLTDTPGGMATTTDFSFLQLVSEVEHRHMFGQHPGAIRGAIWMNRGRLGRFDDSLAWGIANATAPDVSQVQNVRHTRIGGYINVEQELTSTLGLFARASTADGNYGVFDFTDIDTSVSAGLSLAGKSWGRPADTAQIGAVTNSISKVAQAYLAAGGAGVLIGDGSLIHPGAEKIVEASYSWRPNSHLAVTFDLQGVVNPAYNRDSGPVGIVGLRLHASF